MTQCRKLLWRRDATWVCYRHGLVEAPKFHKGFAFCPSRAAYPAPGSPMAQHRERGA